MAARNEHACDTTPLFTSPTSFQQTRAVTSNTHGGFAAAGVWRLSPLRTPIVVNKKTCRASMICVTILRSFFSSILQVSEPKNARQPRFPEQKRQDAA
jgi:hypothetical protein